MVGSLQSRHAAETHSQVLAAAEPDLQGVPEALLPLVVRALAKEADARPTAAELRDACTALLAAQATAAAPRAQEQPTLVADLVSAHWDLLPEDDAAWPTAARGRRVKLVAAVVAFAAVVGGIGGAIAASSASTAEQSQETTLPSSQKKALSAPPAAEPALSRESRDTASPSPSPATPAAVSAEARTPSPTFPTPLQPPPFTYLPDQLDCAPRKEAEVAGAWQYFAPGNVRAGDAVEPTLRNKYGNIDPVQTEMSVLARLYLPDGTSRLARTTVHSDTPATVVWPGDFPGGRRPLPTRHIHRALVRRRRITALHHLHGIRCAMTTCSPGAAASCDRRHHRLRHTTALITATSGSPVGQVSPRIRGASPTGPSLTRLNP